MSDIFHFQSTFSTKHFFSTVWVHLFFQVCHNISLRYSHLLYSYKMYIICKYYTLYYSHCMITRLSHLYWSSCGIFSATISCCIVVKFHFTNVSCSFLSNWIDVDKLWVKVVLILWPDITYSYSCSSREYFSKPSLR